jgi:iron complex outermembrane receptor protein
MTSSTFPFLPRLTAIALLLGACPWAAMANDQQVVIEGQRQHYRALSVTGATKTDTPLADLPQSVRVLTGELLDDAGVTTLAGALDLASGVSRQSNLGGLWDSYAMRGFTGDPNFGSDYLVNGFSSSRGYNGLRDGANTDSVEVLKGPASALYGRGEPGGTVNIVTKKPRFAPSYVAGAGIDRYGAVRSTIDLTGPLSDNLAYRVNAAYEAGDTFRDHVDSERMLLAPSFVWLIGEATTLSYEIEASKQRTPFDRGVVAVKGKLGLIPNSRFLGEPGDGKVTVQSVGQQLFVRHELNPAWSLQGGVSYRDSSLRGFSSQQNDILADGRTARRQRRLNDWAGIDRSGRIEALGTFATGAITHHVLVGADAYAFDDERIQLRRNPSSDKPYAIDIYAPVYGAAVAAPLTLSVSTDESQRSRAVYLQDQVDLSGRWKALLGVRRDSYDQTVVNRRLARSSSQSLGATSPRVGLVYQPTRTLSLYASAAEGFRPNSGISLDNEAFPAESSHAYEVGAKVDSADGKLSTTVALYRITKDNVLTFDPRNTDYSIPAGAVASKGLEVDMAGDIARDVRLSVAYAYTDTVVTEGDNTILTGSRFPNVPRHSATVLVTPRFKLGDGVAMLGGGVNYVGARMGDVAASSDFELPAYTTARLVASWAPNRRLLLALNVDNLFDKRYYASSYSTVWVAPGAERNVRLNARYKF